MKNKRTLVVATLLIVGALLACSSQNQVVKTEPDKIPKATKTVADYIIQSGDELEVKFFYNPELNEFVKVRPDGMISLQFVDEIQATGLRPKELDKILTEKYSYELRKPEITVIVRSFSAQRIYVGGEVNTEGLLELPPAMTALQAVIKAGGFQETADPKSTIVIRRGEGNRPVPLPIDLEKALFGQGDGINFYLQPDDVVFVPKSPIAKANKFVNQYIEQLLLFRGVSFGVSYQINEIQF